MSNNSPSKIMLEGFHGTDQKYINEIIDKGFICKKNEEHWLGNGIYFYADISLAKWWTTNPSKKFGSKINDPAIIKCQIEAERKKVLDLRDLSDYIKFVEIYREEFLRMFYSVHIEINEDNKMRFAKKIRCAYCDYIQKRLDLIMIIGNFDIPEQPYQPKEYGELFNKFDIKYIETQICIYNQDIIINKENTAF